MKKLTTVILVCLLTLTMAGMQAVAETDDGFSHYNEWGCAEYCFILRTTNMIAHKGETDADVCSLYGVRLEASGFRTVLFPDVSEEEALEKYGFLEYNVLLHPEIPIEEAIALLKAHTDIISVRPRYPELYPDYSYEEIQPDYKYFGDINENCELDMSDYILAKRAYFGTYRLPNGNVRLAADVSKNGEIDMTDYILIKRMYFGTWSPGKTVESTPDEAVIG